MGLFGVEGDDNRAAKVTLLKIDRLVLRVVAGDRGADVGSYFAPATVTGEAGGHDGNRAVVADGLCSVVRGQFFYHWFRRFGGVPSGQPCFEHGAVGGVGLIIGITNAQRGAADAFDLGELLADLCGEREGFEAAISDGGFGAFARDFFLQGGHQAGKKATGDLIADFLGVGGRGNCGERDGEKKRTDARRGDRRGWGEAVDGRARQVGQEFLLLRL